MREINLLSKSLKPFCQAILTSISIWVVIVNCKLYFKPTFAAIEGHQINRDVYHQLNFLKKRLHNGEGDKMQSLFPEGFIFLNALYGLIWCNFDVEFPGGYR